MTDLHAIARRWVALWNGDMSLLDGLVAEAAVTHAVTIGQVTEAPMIGRDALGGWIAQTHGMMPTLRFTVEVGPLVDGDLIALRWRCTGDHGAARIDFAGTDILRVEDGLIAEYWVNSDTGLMMVQMQAAMPPRLDRDAAQRPVPAMRAAELHAGVPAIRSARTFRLLLPWGGNAKLLPHLQSVSFVSSKMMVDRESRQAITIEPVTSKDGSYGSQHR